MFYRIAVLLLFFVMNGPALAQVARPVVGEDSSYVSVEGDTLLSIAEAHDLAIEHLAFANGFPVSSLDIVPNTILVIPGQRVLPLDPPKNGLVLNIPERALFFFQNGKFVEFIPVSIGGYPDSKTPIGSFHVIEKVVNPTWYPTAKANEHKPVPPGPNNPLGDRWIGLSAPHVGIHGTNNPLNVGGPVTLGCIRCYPDHIRRLFPKVQVGMPIRIEYETAKIGKTANGKLVLVNFPDVYQRSDTQVRSANLLRQVGKESLLEDPRFLAKVKLNLGVTLGLVPSPPITDGRPGRVKLPKPADETPPGPGPGEPEEAEAGPLGDQEGLGDHSPDKAIPLPTP